MVEKIYLIRIPSRDLENEITYIKNTYNSNSCGKLTGQVLKTRIDFATQEDEHTFIQDMTSRGATAVSIDGEQISDLSTYHKIALDNKVMFQVTQNVQLNALSTSYVNVFPNLYSNLPIPIDTTGYKKMGMVLLWNKNSGVGTHTIKLVKCNSSGVIIDNPEVILRETNVGAGGYLSDFSYDLPAEFIDFKGFVKLQAKSSNGTDNPRFDGLWLYMIRR